MNYTEFVIQLAAALSDLQTQMDFEAFVPRIIEASESRIYRETNLLATLVTDSSGTLTANSRDYTLTSAFGNFAVVDSMNVIVSGARSPLTPTSRDYINFSWPSSTAPSATTVPKYFAMTSNKTVILGPPPGDNFTIEVIGYVDPTPLSASNPTTILSTELPDLFMAAALAVGFSYAQGPKGAAQSALWEAAYRELLPTAQATVSRQHFSSASWTSKEISKSAVPQRG